MMLKTGHQPHWEAHIKLNSWTPHHGPAKALINSYEFFITGDGTCPLLFAVTEFLRNRLVSRKPLTAVLVNYVITDGPRTTNSRPIGA
jgi:hypothetical protein